MKTDRKYAFAFAYAVLLLSCALQAEDKCPVEAKVLLSPQTIHEVIAALGFQNKTEGQVHFFDTDKLDLLRQGVIARIRQGADNDVTVKVRAPEGNKVVDTSQLRKSFQCEIDRTRAGENTSYAVRRHYNAQVPETGSDIFSLLNPEQEKLLREARVSIDWQRVMRIANIKSTKWETRAQSPFRKLTLELWEWPGGSILELSTKVGPSEGQSTDTELQRLVNMKGLALSATQGTKTRMVLENIINPTFVPGCR